MTLCERYDMIVVGGGPAGCEAARVAAGRGLSVLVVEKDPDIGSPVRCGEAVPIPDLQKFYEPHPSFCSEPITEYHVVCPDGSHIEVSTPVHTVVLERKIFDRRVAEDAARAGARIVTSCAAMGASRVDGGLVSVTLEGERAVRAPIVIGADGTEGRVGRWLGLKTASKPRDLGPAAQYLLAGVDVAPRRMEFHFGREIAPGGYLWIFPKGPCLANVGVGITGLLGTGKTPFDFLDKAVAERWPEASIIGRTTGGVPCTGGLKKKVADGVMLIGDAAHQANPLTGGGILNGMTAGRMAAEVAVSAIAEGDCSERSLRRYEKQWDDYMGGTHRKLYRVKEVLHSLSDERFNDLAAAANSLKPEDRTVANVAARALAKSPGMLLNVLRAVY